MSNSDVYLRAILGIVSRQVIPPDELAGKIGVGKTKLKQIEAYNLCDGSMTQGAIAKNLGLDSGNFSKTMTRWSDEGLIVRTEISGEMRPVHLYPIPDAAIKAAAKGA